MSACLRCCGTALKGSEPILRGVVHAVRALELGAVCKDVQGPEDSK